MTKFHKISFYKSFSIIEIIFVILILSIVTTLSLPNFFNTLDEAKFDKLRSDIATIQLGLHSYKNMQTMKNQPYNLSTLEDDNQFLFSKILKKPFVSNENDGWSKIDDTTYQFHFSSDESLEFYYDSNEMLFDCDIKESLCQKVKN